MSGASDRYRDPLRSHLERSHGRLLRSLREVVILCDPRDAHYATLSRARDAIENAQSVEDAVYRDYPLDPSDTIT